MGVHTPPPSKVFDSAANQYPWPWLITDTNNRFRRSQVIVWKQSGKKNKKKKKNFDKHKSISAKCLNNMSPYTHTLETVMMYIVHQDSNYKTIILYYVMVKITTVIVPSCSGRPNYFHQLEVFVSLLDIKLHNLVYISEFVLNLLLWPDKGYILVTRLH